MTEKGQRGERVMGKVRSLTYEDNQSATLADMHEYAEALERERDEARAERDTLAGYILLMADRDAVRASTGRTTHDDPTSRTLPGLRRGTEPVG